MNARQAIQPSNQPAVLSVSFSSSSNRFVAGLSEGFRCFRTDNCLTTNRSSLPSDGGAAIVEALDDRYLAYVGGGRAPAGSPNVVVFWDALLGKEVSRFDFYEPVVGVRLGTRWMVVVLKERAVVFEYQHLWTQALPTPPPDVTAGLGNNPDGGEYEEVLRGPNVVKAIYPTSLNTHALACIKDSMLALPAQSTGQVQLVPLEGGSKRVLRAHNSDLRCLALSSDGSLLASSSVQGTLIRVFNLKTLDQIAEFRRGMDHAIVYGLAFSPGNRWLASTSDKGTLHIFDLRPADSAGPTREHEAKDRTQPRKSQNYATHRLSGTSALDKDSLSAFSGRSSPTSAGTATATGYQGSVQEYYGLRPPPTSASPSRQQAAVSAIQALKASPFAPRMLKDIRSVASAAFYIGNAPPHWQGGPAYSWTVAPNGTRKRVRNPVMLLPSEPSGKPPKGIAAFAPRKEGQERDDATGAVLWVVGGGGDARWEMFELLPVDNGGWALVNRGFRRYLTRQFVD